MVILIGMRNYEARLFSVGPIMRKWYRNKKGIFSPFLEIKEVTSVICLTEQAEPPLTDGLSSPKVSRFSKMQYSLSSVSITLSASRAVETQLHLNKTQFFVIRMNKTKGSVTVILNPLKFSERLNSSFANFARGKKVFFSGSFVSSFLLRTRNCLYLQLNLNSMQLIRL